MNSKAIDFLCSIAFVATAKSEKARRSTPERKSQRSRYIPAPSMREREKLEMSSEEVVPLFVKRLRVNAHKHDFSAFRRPRYLAFTRRNLTNARRTSAFWGRSREEKT